MGAPNVNTLLMYAYTDANVITEGDDMTNLQLSQGLARLNAILLDLGTTNITVPYQYNCVFNLTSGVPNYTFDANQVSPRNKIITSLNYVKILIGSVWHPIEIITEGQFNLDDRIAGNYASSIPDFVYLTKESGSSAINFYLPPSQNFSCTVNALVQNTAAKGTTYISDLPDIYFKYLWYQLACEISLANRGIPMPDGYVAEAQRLFLKIKNQSNINLVADPNVFCQSGGGVPKPIQTAGFA